MHLHNIKGCQNVHVHDVSIMGDFNFPETDGIDIDSSVGVLVSDVDIDVGDDGVCIKSSAGYGPVQDVHVRKSAIRSKSSAIKVYLAYVLLCRDAR